MGRANLRYDSANFTITQHLFRQYLVANDLTTDDAEETSIRDFYTWLAGEELLFPDAKKLKATYGFTNLELSDYAELVKDPFAFVADVYMYWPLVVFGFRPQAQNVPDSVAINVQLDWPDKLVQLPVAAAVPEGVPLDGYVLTMIRKLIQETAGLIISEGGVDSLYSRSADTEVGEDGVEPDRMA